MGLSLSPMECHIKQHDKMIIYCQFEHTGFCCICINNFLIREEPAHQYHRTLVYREQNVIV